MSAPASAAPPSLAILQIDPATAAQILTPGAALPSTGMRHVSTMQRAQSPSKYDKATLLALNPAAAASSRTYDATIPVVDMQDFWHPETKDRFVAGVAKALREVGFFAVVNPGVDVATLNGAYDAAKAYFARSHEEKIKQHDRAVNGQRGYVPGESAKGQASGDVKEFYHVGREMTAEQADRLKYYRNIWPEGVTLEKPLTALFRALQMHMLPIQEAMALAIGKPAGFFDEMTKEGDLLLRSIHYPKNPPANSFWAAEHTDIDLFTILPRATADGLQVLNKDGEWVDVKVPENSFIINAGDMLENITNGEFKSARHRVVDNGSGQDRYSMVLFVHPRSSDRLDPLPECVARTGGVKKYAEANRWELLMERLADLGLASDAMIVELAQSGLMDRLIEVGRASQKAMEALASQGLASEKVKQKLAELQPAG